MKKLFITVLLSVMSVTTAYAFTAQTKGSIISKYWRDQIKHDVVLIDRDIITIKGSEIRTDVGDDVLINVLIGGDLTPMMSGVPIITIIYRIENGDHPSMNNSRYERDDHPPFN